MHINPEELLTYSEKEKILYKEKGFSLPKNIDKKNLTFLNSAVLDDAKSWSKFSDSERLINTYRCYDFIEETRHLKEKNTTTDTLPMKKIHLEGAR